jgi:hypothetical protein
MARQFTPEEEAIIRETMRQGEEEAAKDPSPRSGRHTLLAGALIFIIIFSIFVFLGFLIVRAVS